MGGMDDITTKQCVHLPHFNGRSIVLTWTSHFETHLLHPIGDRAKLLCHSFLHDRVLNPCSEAATSCVQQHAWACSSHTSPPIITVHRGSSPPFRPNPHLHLWPY